MEKLLEMVYYRQVNCNRTDRILYKSRGVLVDVLKDYYGLKYASNAISLIEEVKLYADAKQDDHTDGGLLYCKGDPMEATRFYTRAAFQHELLDRHVEGLNVSYVTSHSYMYPEPKYPMKVELELSDNGGYMTRIKQQPNWTGLQVQGKVFFVDREWKDKAWEGEALVSIKKETDTAGFLSGQMIVKGYCDEEDFRDYCWNQQLHPHRRISKFELPTGEIVFGLGEVSTYRHDLTVVHKTSTGQFNSIIWKFTKEQWEAGIKDTWYYSDYANQDVFGKEFATWEIFNRPTLCDYYEKAVWFPFDGIEYTRYTHLQASWCATSSVKGYDGVFQRAVDCGLVSVYALGTTGIYCCVFTVNMLDRMTLFTREELDELAEAMTNLNEAANDSIKKRLQNGKLRIVTRLG